MNIRNVVKKAIYIGASTLVFVLPDKKHTAPDRSNNYQKLIELSKDHPIYSQNTFVDSPLQEEVDVSIVIPFYCAKQEYIDVCLGSLMEQKTKYSYKVICVEDGSKDDTLSRLLKYQEKYPEKVYVYHQSNAGISCARNRGIQLSNAKYIGFVDQDDWVEQDYIEKLVDAAFLKNADVVKCSHKVVKNQCTISTYVISDKILNGKTDTELLEYSGMIWSGIYKKEILNKVRFPEKYWYEDMIARNLLYRCADIFVSISDVLYVKRKHDENTSTVLWTGKNNKCYDHLYLFKHLLEENDILGLQRNIVLKKSMLYELGQYLMWRTRGQETAKRKIAFIEACFVVQEYIDSIEGLSNLEKMYYKCFINFDYKKWLLISWKDWSITE